MTPFLYVTSVILISLYGILMTSLLFGWFKVKKRLVSEMLYLPVISVIIPYRNEKENLPALINNLSRQDYPAELLEFVFIDDHSKDGGNEIVDKQSANLKSNVLHIQNPEGKSGKKVALRNGAHLCKGDILLLTDADCQFKPDWISSMAKAFSDQEIQMVQGPVLIHPTESLAGNLQQIEFLSLMMSSAGSIGIKRPILASGANLAVRRLTYLEGSKNLKDQINTGDDMFLLEYLKRENKNSIFYNASQNAIVRTRAVSSFSTLWNQRKRWTSKSTKYQDPEITGTAILVFLLNLMIVCSLFLSLFYSDLLLIPLLLLGIKTLTELPLIIAGCQFYSILKKLKWFFVAQLTYPFYVVSVAIAGVFGGFNWKNRTRHTS